MFRLIFTLFCLLAVPVLAQNRPRITLQTVSQLGTRYPFSNEIAEVISYATPGDWIDKKIFRWDATNALATNALRIKAAPSVGRYIHDWDGDARLFGAFNSSVSDVGATINIANTNAVALGIPLLLPEGSFNVSNWVNLISGSHVRGKGMGKTILLRNSSSASQTNTHVHATIQTPGVFNPYSSAGGHGADVTASASQGVLEDLSISEAVGSYSGFPLAIMAAEDFTIQRVEIYGVTNHWAITLHGNRLKAVDNLIENTGRVYQDGIHFLGGRDSIISRNIIRSGDDAIAISSGGATDPLIRNILVSDNSLYSSHGHVLRVFQENTTATNYFEGLRFVNNSGTGGFNRNGIIRLSSASASITNGLRDISISKGSYQTGTFADHGSDVNQGGFGIYAEDCQGLKFENISVGPTIFESFRIISCDDVELNNVTAVGATYSGFFNNTVRVENTKRLEVIGGDYRNIYTNGAQVFALANVESSRFSGVFISNTVSGGGAVGVFSNSTALAPGMISLIGNTIHSKSRVMLNGYFDPTNFIAVNNEIVSPGLALFANGTSTPIPGHYIVDGNVGFDKGYFRSPRIQTTNSTYMSQWFTDGSGYAVMMGTNGLIRFAQDEVGPGSKSIRLSFQSISNNLPSLFALHSDDGSFPYYRMGYGSSLNTSPRWWSFGNAGTNYTQGLETLRLDLPTNPGDLSLLLRAAGSNGLVRLRISSTNTVPAGAKVLYID